jgi:putative ABC transport system substrate-binding protein
LGQKRWEILKEVVPAATRIAVLQPVDNPTYKALNPKEHQPAARLVQVDFYLMEVRDSATNLEHAFAALAHERVDALLVNHDPSFTPHIPRIVALVAESRLPASYPLASYVQAGGLMAYREDHLAIRRRAGVMVGKILQGTKPADIPAEYPTQFRLSINLKTAQALGITIPRHLLMLADEVIR